MYICHEGACVRRAEGSCAVAGANDVRRCRDAEISIFTAAHVAAQHLIKLRGSHPKCFLDGILNRLILIFSQVEINGRLRNKLVA